MIPIKALLSKDTKVEQNKTYVYDKIHQLKQIEFFEGVNSFCETVTTSIECCGFSVDLGQEEAKTDKRCPAVVGLYLKKSSHLLAVLIGCFKVGAPIMCLDAETFGLYSKQILANIKLNIILMPADSSKRDQLLIKLKGFSLRKEFKLWDLKLHLWFRDETSMDETIKPPFLFAVLTSGSTGEPKLVRVPESSILPNVYHLW